MAAAEKLTNGYNVPADVRAASFSAFGPTDDGRIKPDITGIGVNLLSTFTGANDAYNSISGTSMATPNIAGSLLLLQQHYRDLNNGQFMKAATLKALALGTASEAGLKGPDYSYGWGLLNSLKAAVTLSTNNKYSLVQERTLNNGTQDSIQLKAVGNEPLKATIVWNDPAPVTNGEETGLNDRTKTLVNDLDIKISDGTNTFQPWVLDPNNPGNAATNGDNSIDNVEQVFIENPEAGKVYTIFISHKNSLKKNLIVNDSITLEDSAKQDYSLVITGINNGVNTDMELSSIKIDKPAIDYSAATPVIVTYKNKGTSTVTDAKLVYTITNSDTGATETTNTINLPSIDSGAEASTTFNIDLSKSFINYKINAEITLTGDEVSVNNKQYTTAFGTIADLQPLESSHTYNFETDFNKYGWISEDIDGDGRTWRKYDDAGFAHTGNSFALNFSNTTAGTNDWLYSNPLKLKAGGKYRVVFYTRKLRDDVEKMNVAIGNTPNSTAMVDVLASDIVATKSYVKYVYQYTPSKDGIFYLGFQNLALAGNTSYAIFLDDVYIDQSEKPLVDYTASKTAVNTYETVTFTDTSYTDAANPITSYNWTITPNTVTYVGNTNNTSKNPQVIFNQQGKYTVSLDVVNAKGSASLTKTDYIIAANTPIVADFTSSNPDIYVGNTVSFSNSSTGNPLPTSFIWEFTPSDGVSFVNSTTNTSKNPVVQFNKKGLYTAKLTATGPQGSNVKVKTDYVSVASYNAVRNLKGSAAADGTATLTWSRPVLAAVYSEGFEGTPKLSANIDEDGDDKKWVLTTYSPYVHSGTKSILSYSWTSATNAIDVDNWFVTSKITQGAAQLSFWVKHNYNEKYDVYLVKKSDIAGTTPTLAEIKAGAKVYDFTAPDLREDFVNITADISAYQTSDMFLAFHHKSRVADDGFTLAIDDIEVGYDNRITNSQPDVLKPSTSVKKNVDKSLYLSLDIDDVKTEELKEVKDLSTPIVVVNATGGTMAPLVGYDIFRDNTKVSSITDPEIKTFSEVLTVPKEYTYDVVANYANGQVSDKATVIIDITALATNETETSKELVVYPNPSSGKFAIKAASQVKTLDALVYDMSGKLVVKESSKSNELDLDLTNNGQGVYILVVVDNNGKKDSVKLIVK